jgi:hypothetical protein
MSTSFKKVLQELVKGRRGGVNRNMVMAKGVFSVLALIPAGQNLDKEDAGRRL